MWAKTYGNSMDFLKTFSMEDFRKGLPAYLSDTTRNPSCSLARQPNNIQVYADSSLIPRDLVISVFSDTSYEWRIVTRVRPLD